MERSNYCDICKNKTTCSHRGGVPDMMDIKPSCYVESEITFRVVSVDGNVGIVVTNNYQLKHELMFKYLDVYSLDKPMVEDIEQHSLYDNNTGIQLLLVRRHSISSPMFSLSPLLKQKTEYGISTITTITVKRVSDLLKYVDRVVLCKSGKGLSDEKEN